MSFPQFQFNVFGSSVETILVSYVEFENIDTGNRPKFDCLRCFWVETAGKNLKIKQ